MKTTARWDQTYRPHIVVGAAFVTLALLYGIWYSYAVFLVALTTDLAWSRSVVAGAFSLFVLVHGALGPLFGPLAQRLQPRRVIMVGACAVTIGLLLAAETARPWHLYLAFGGLTAAGIGISGYVPLVVFVRGWFPTRVGTAVGIASAGIGLGISTFVPLSQLLIEHLGWRWAFRVLAVLVAAWLLPASRWLLHDPPGWLQSFAASPRRGGPEAGASWTLPSAIRSSRFWGLAVVLFMHNMAVQLLMIHQVAYLVDHQVSAMTAATLAGLVGMVSIAGKPAWGFLMDRMLREQVFTMASVCLAASVGLLVLSGSRPTGFLPYGYALVLGLGYAVTAPVTPAVSSDLFKGPGFPVIFGWLHMALCVGTAMGAWAGGEVFDRTGGYGLALAASVSLALLACGLLWLVAPRRPNPCPGGCGPDRRAA